MLGDITELSDADIFATHPPEHHLLLEVYANWCKPCRQLRGTLHEALKQIVQQRASAKNPLRAARIDGAVHVPVTRRFSIEDAPSVLFFRVGDFQNPAAQAHVSEFLSTESTQRQAIVNASAVSTWIDQALQRQLMPPEPEDPFTKCLLKNAMASWSHVLHPPEGSPLRSFAMCRNQTCVEEAHAQLHHGTFSPVAAMASPAIASPASSIFDAVTAGAASRGTVAGLGELPGQASVPIRQVRCGRRPKGKTEATTAATTPTRIKARTSACARARAATAVSSLCAAEQPEEPLDDKVSAATALRHARAAFATSEPLVLRGCATRMPAVRRWRNSSYLRAQLQQAGDADGSHSPFAPLLAEADAMRDGVGQLEGGSWLEDLSWKSPLSAELLGFTTSPHAWVSTGGKDAAMHFDTVDNYHAVVGDGAKQFDLISPSDLPNLYIDFPPQTRSEDAVVRCPDRESFGCDDFGCFGYPPFSAEAVDFAEYPRVADATVHTATLQTGDVLVVPAFWTHRVRHHPMGGGGRNIGLAFIRNHPAPSVRPFAHDIAAWHRAGAGAGSAGTPSPPDIEQGEGVQEKDEL